MDEAGGNPTLGFTFVATIDEAEANPTKLLPALSIVNSVDGRKIEGGVEVVLSRAQSDESERLNEKIQSRSGRAS
ncbi:Hypothetical predicted protein [Olea europaea subsp. europaea]|uniref:Uncharacterized protein n=1 Tax=Olea europaea subsp. europaea TaxID=158383 RepID=A0A8S0QZ80_OLEEU|nr:Hypothetical predicted protein [Olea europaea subsp. europaea]